MLHAELAGKITPDADDIARREDVLTSTVFGTLFLANAWPVVTSWLGRAHPVGHTSALAPPKDPVDGAYWFWPRLYDAEPDVVLRCGSLLVVVEAKYLSGKSSSSVLDGLKVVEPTDQLLREWRACSRGVDTNGYPRDLCDAIDVCELALVYLVRRARWARELRAVKDSVSQEDGTRMYTHPIERPCMAVPSGAEPPRDARHPDGCASEGRNSTGRLAALVSTRCARDGMGTRAERRPPRATRPTRRTQVGVLIVGGEQ